MGRLRRCIKLLYLIISDSISVYPHISFIFYCTQISHYAAVVVFDYISYISVQLSIPHYIWFYLTIHPHISIYFPMYGERYKEMWRVSRRNGKTQEKHKVSIPHCIWFYLIISPHILLSSTIHRYKEIWKDRQRTTKIQEMYGDIERHREMQGGYRQILSHEYAHLLAIVDHVHRMTD